MSRSPFARPPVFRRLGAATATLALALVSVPLWGLPASAAPSPGPAAGSSASALPVSDTYRPSADIGFHDSTRDGSERPIRDDLSGSLGGMVEFAQATTVDPTGNAERETPTLTAERPALLLFTPTSAIEGASLEVRVDGEVKGTVELDHPNLLPASDQVYDSRGTVAYSLRAWSAQLPAQWVQPGLSLTVVAADGTEGTLETVDIAAPKELVINNIRLGMLTDAPVGEEHAFLRDPVGSGTDYFQTIPVSRLTIAQYETVELEEVIVASGARYTANDPDPSEGSVYAGTMREDVGKAQVSTGINLATWGITSSPMTQRQPGHTNQRIIHHSAGLYANGRHAHGLSGGNGMATLYSSTGNELSHELGHSYGLGHFPGTDLEASGDDVIRDAVHNHDSGWGYIGHRGLMRANLDVRDYREPAEINGHPFSENVAGAYNFNHDAMSGGWDASPVSNYTHHTAYSLVRIQDYLQDLVADTEYPSGYRAWDEEAGDWADAAALDADFDLPAPAEVGVPVFTILGGYNPADAEQTLVYPAFRSNYGVTFDLPQVDPAAVSEERSCWLEVDFADADTQRIALDASDGVKQLNVNIAESKQPTGAQVHCRADDTTTALGDRIDIATDLEPMPQATVVGGDAEFEALRAQELDELEPVLEGLAETEAPILSTDQLIVLQGWSDDLSALSESAQEVAERILTIQQDAADVEAYLLEHAPGGEVQDERALAELSRVLEERGYLDASGELLPAGSPVTVDDGRCLFRDGASLRVDADAENCAASHDDTWFRDLAGRIHPADQPELCLQAAAPVTAQPCSLTDTGQRWVLEDDGHLVRAAGTSSVLDYHRTEGIATLYSSSGTSNQIWKTFETSDNPLLAYLSADGLAAAAAVGELPEPAEPREPEPEPTEPDPTPEPEPEPTDPPVIEPEPTVPPSTDPDGAEPTDPGEPEPTDRPSTESGAPETPAGGDPGHEHPSGDEGSAAGEDDGWSLGPDVDRPDVDTPESESAAGESASGSGAPGPDVPGPDAVTGGAGSAESEQEDRSKAAGEAEAEAADGLATTGPGAARALAVAAAALLLTGAALLVTRKIRTTR